MFRIIAAIFHEKTGKVKMIFGAVCIAGGIGMFAAYDHLLRPTRRPGLLEYMAHELGQVGCAAVYIVPGIALLAWGVIQKRSNKV